MITFLNLGSMGRLGNQLFQYAALRSLSLNNNYEVKIPDPSTKNWHGQNCLLNKLNINVPFLEDSDLAKIKCVYKEKDTNKIDNNFYQTPDNVSLDGFFQSMFYFEKFSKEIKKELTPKLIYLKKAQDYINSLKLKYPNYQIVSVHVRRGDNMVNNQNELINAYKKHGIYEKYFIEAKKIFRELKVKFLVFTGGARYGESNSEDVKWCKSFFGEENFLFSEGKSEMEDFCAIINCDHNILSHASSFGWWAAYLNNSSKKITVAPKYACPDSPNIIREKFYPEEYILL